MRLGSWISRCTLWLVVLCASLTLAHADPKSKTDGCLKDPECHAHYQQALAQYDAGRYDDALVGFQAAYARRQMPWLLINIGRTVQRLGRPQEAINYYERYKKAEPNIDAEAEGRINKFIEQARALLEQTPEQQNLPTPPPPNPTPEPTVAAAPPPINLNPVPPPADQPASKPVYKKWWFWTIVGVVVAGGVAGAVAGVALGQKSPPAEPFQPSDTIYTPTF